MSPRVRLRTPFDRFRGSLHQAGQQSLTVYDSPNNAQVARRLTPHAITATAAQLRVRAAFKAMAAEYRNLPASTAADWNAAAADYRLANRLGLLHAVSGWTLFAAVNGYRQALGWAISSDVPASLAPPFLDLPTWTVYPCPSDPTSFSLSLMATPAPGGGTSRAVIRLARTDLAPSRRPQPSDYRNPRPGDANAVGLDFVTPGRQTVTLVATREAITTGQVVHTLAEALNADFVPGPEPIPYNVTAAPTEPYWFACCDNAATSTVRDHGPQQLDRTLTQGATPVNTSACSIPGIFGQALALTGSARHVRLATGATQGAWLAALLGAGRDFTIALWMRPHHQPTGSRTHFQLSSPAPSLSFFANSQGTNNEEFYVRFLPPGTGAYLGYCYTNYPRANWDNRWLHVAITRQGSTWRGWSNGAQPYNSATDTETPTGGNAAAFNATGTCDFQLSGYPGTNNVNNHGNLDIQDVRLYSRALTAAEISALYNAGAGNPYSLPAP